MICHREWLFISAASLISVPYTRLDAVVNFVLGNLGPNLPSKGNSSRSRSFCYWSGKYTAHLSYLIFFRASSPAEDQLLNWSSSTSLEARSTTTLFTWPPMKTRRFSANWLQPCHISIIKILRLRTVILSLEISSLWKKESMGFASNSQILASPKRRTVWKRSVVHYTGQRQRSTSKLDGIRDGESTPHVMEFHHLVHGPTSCTLELIFTTKRLN